VNRKKELLVTAASFALILAVLLTGCPSHASPTPTATETPTSTPTATVTATATATATTTATATPAGVEMDYNCLNPQGNFQPVQTYGLSRRLTTIKNMIICVNQGEADPIIMPALYDRVQADYPDTRWKLIAVSSFGPAAIEADVKASCAAVIRGIAW